MKDFRTNRKKNLDDILDVVPNTIVVEKEGGKTETIDTLDIHFADGRVFKNVAYSKENLKKIEERQEKQASEGVENLPVFTRRLTKDGIMTGAAIVGGPIIGNALASAVEKITATEADPTKVFIGIGAITLGLMTPGICSLVRDFPIVRQLQKIKFRNENREVLNSFDQYENALAGLPSAKAEEFVECKENGTDPFSIRRIDDYTCEDLKTIVDNIQREKAYQFTYVKTASH